MTFKSFDVPLHKKRCITAKILRGGIQITNVDIDQSGWYSADDNKVEVYPNPSSHLHATVHGEKKGSSTVWAGWQVDNGDVMYFAFIVNVT